MGLRRGRHRRRRSDGRRVRLEPGQQRNLVRKCQGRLADLDGTRAVDGPLDPQRLRGRRGRGRRYRFTRVHEQHGRRALVPEQRSASVHRALDRRRRLGLSHTRRRRRRRRRRRPAGGRLCRQPNFLVRERVRDPGAHIHAQADNVAAAHARALLRHARADGNAELRHGRAHAHAGADGARADAAALGDVRHHGLERASTFRGHGRFEERVSRGRRPRRRHGRGGCGRQQGHPRVARKRGRLRRIYHRARRDEHARRLVLRESARRRRRRRRRYICVLLPRLHRVVVGKRRVRELCRTRAQHVRRRRAVGHRSRRRRRQRRGRSRRQRGR